MPTLTYQGDYGTSQRLDQARTAALSLVGTLPETPILVSSAYARIYVSTSSRPYTYQYHVEIDDGYTGDLDYNFAHTDEAVYVNVPIDVDMLDPDFPLRTISTITLTEIGGHGESTRIRGTVKVVVNYVDVLEPTGATNLRLNGETAINLEAGTTATLSWTAGALGAYDNSLSYNVVRYDPEAETYTLVDNTTNTSLVITAPYTDSKSYYYYVDVVTTYHEKRSEDFASIFTFIQLTAPTILGAGENPVYNPRPMLLVTLGNGPIDEYLTLLADGWTASRKAYPGEKIYLLKNRSYSTDTTATVTLTETDERMRSISTDLAVDYAAPVYTNPEIIAGTTMVLAADITELQEILANIRTAYGMTGYTFTPCVQGETSLTLWVTHITELQNCILQIRDFVNAWDTESPTYQIVLPTMIATVGPSAAVMNQLRKIVTML